MVYLGIHDREVGGEVSPEGVVGGAGGQASHEHPPALFLGGQQRHPGAFLWWLVVLSCGGW